MNWDESKIYRSPKGFAARCSGVYFDEDYANGQINALKDLKVLSVQTYSEIRGEDPDGKDIVILSMEFIDDFDMLALEAPLYSGNTFELTREHIAVHYDFDVDCDIGQEITAYIKTLFDVDKKFGLDINDEPGSFLRMYAKYNPFADTLRIECEIDACDYSKYFDYEPIGGESKLIKGMITEKISEIYDMTPKEFCDSAQKRLH